MRDNTDVLKFVEDVKGFDFVDVYVEHSVEEPELVDEAELWHDFYGDVYPNSNDDEVVSVGVDVDVGDCDEEHENYPIYRNGE